MKTKTNQRFSTENLDKEQFCNKIFITFSVAALAGVEASASDRQIKMYVSAIFFQILSLAHMVKVVNILLKGNSFNTT